MRFKIDENLPVEVADLLRRHSHNTLTVTEQQLNGQPDARIATQSISSVLQLLRRVLSLLAEQPLMGALWIVDERRVRIRGAEGA